MRGDHTYLSLSLPETYTHTHRSSCWFQQPLSIIMAPVAELQIFSSGVLLDTGSDSTIFVSTMRKFCLRCKLTKTTETQDFSHTAEYFKTTVMITYIFYSFKFYWTYPSLSPDLCYSENTVVHRHWDTNQGKFLYADISHIVWFSPTDFFLCSFPCLSLSLSLCRSLMLFWFSTEWDPDVFLKCMRRESRGQEGEGRDERWGECAVL